MRQSMVGRITVRCFVSSWRLLFRALVRASNALSVWRVMHLLQSAEAIRKDYPNEDWLHLTALIHGIFCYIYALYSFYYINLMGQT